MTRRKRENPLPFPRKNFLKTKPKISPSFKIAHRLKNKIKKPKSETKKGQGNSCIYPEYNKFNIIVNPKKFSQASLFLSKVIAVDPNPIRISSFLS